MSEPMQKENSGNDKLNYLIGHVVFLLPELAAAVF
jgi:hypothetical protein